jgi:hypothetical protein
MAKFYYSKENKENENTINPTTPYSAIDHDMIRNLRGSATFKYESDLKVVTQLFECRQIVAKQIINFTDEAEKVTLFGMMDILNDKIRSILFL